MSSLEAIKRDLLEQRAALSELLAIVEVDDATPGQIAAGWSRAVREPEVYERMVVEMTDPDARRVLGEELEENRRLNALVLATVTRKHGEVADRLQAVRASQRRGRYYDSAPSPGGSCDIPG